MIFKKRQKALVLLALFLNGTASAMPVPTETDSIPSVSRDSFFNGTASAVDPIPTEVDFTSTEVDSIPRASQRTVDGIKISRLLSQKEWEYIKNIQIKAVLKSHYRNIIFDLSGEATHIAQLLYSEDPKTLQQIMDKNILPSPSIAEQILNSLSIQKKTSDFRKFIDILSTTNKKGRYWAETLIQELKNKIKTKEVGAFNAATSSAITLSEEEWKYINDLQIKEVIASCPGTKEGMNPELISMVERITTKHGRDFFLQNFNKKENTTFDIDDALLYFVIYRDFDSFIRFIDVLYNWFGIYEVQAKKIMQELKNRLNASPSKEVAIE